MNYSNKKFSLKIVYSLALVLFFTSVKLIAQPLTVNAGPDQTICNGASIGIGGTPTADFGTPGYTYSWAPTSGLSATNVSNPTASPTSTTTYTITVTDAFPTTVTDVVTITVTPLPATPTPGSNSPICDGTNLNLTAAPVAGATYSWTGPNTFSSSLQNPTIVGASALSAGTYSLTVTVGGCTSLVGTTSVVVNPLPTVTGLLSPLVCNGATVAGTSFTSSPGGATFNWTNSNTSIGIPASGAGNVPTFTATNSGSTLIGGTISVTATLAGCTGPPTNYTISVKPTPIASCSPMSQTRCSGVNCNFSLNSTVSGTTYSWTTTGTGVSGNTPSSGTVISQGVTATTSSPGTANYYVTPMAAGCAGTTINPVLTVNPIPVATVTTSPLTRCSGDTVSFSVSSNVAGTTFTWTTGITNVSGVSPLSGSGNSVFDTLTATTLSAGTVAYLFTPEAAGCTGSAVFPFVTVNPPLDPNFSYSSSGCQFSTNALPSFLPGAGAGTFTASPISMVINDSTGEIDLTATPPGSYLVTNTIPASGGCPSTNANNGFTVTAFPDVTAFPASYPAMCSGSLASVSFSSSVGGTTFPWTSSEVNTSGSALSGSGFISEFLSAGTTAGTTTYTITPTLSGCTGTPLTYVINVNPAPDATFNLVSPACQFAPNVFPGFTTGTAGVFSSMPAGLVFVSTTTGEIDLTASAPGTYDVTNTIAASGGCSMTFFNLSGFVISPFYDATITDIPTVCNSVSPFNFSAASTGGVWSGTGITNASIGTFDPLIAGIGTHTITYVPPGVCSPSDTTIITVTSGDLYGKVTYSGGDLNSGLNTAVLFNHSLTMSSFDTAQVSSIDGLGYYHFPSVLGGDYLVKVFADTLVYPLVVPSYYANEYLWDSATVHAHGCITDTADVLMSEGIVGVGPGMISGNVSEGSGFVRTPGDPIPGLDVKLGKNPGGAMISSTQTNIAGNFDFTNLGINAPGEYYTIYIDIPGLGRDSVYNIYITATDTVFTMMDHLADSNSVYPIYPVTVSVASYGSEDVQFVVYPNPTNTNSTVEYVLKSNSTVQLEVYDVLGKKLETLVNGNQPAGKHNVNLAKLNAGIYFVKLNINNNSNTTRLVVID